MKPALNAAQHPQTPFAIILPRVLDTDGGVEVHVSEALKSDPASATVRGTLRWVNSINLVISYRQVKPDAAGVTMSVQTPRHRSVRKFRRTPKLTHRSGYPVIVADQTGTVSAALATATESGAPHDCAQSPDAPRETCAYATHCVKDGSRDQRDQVLSQAASRAQILQGDSNAWRLTVQYSQQSPLDEHRSICEIPRVELDIDEAAIPEVGNMIYMRDSASQTVTRASRWMSH